MDPDLIGQHVYPDGRLAAMEKGDRAFIHVSHDRTVRFDPDLVVERHDASTLRLTAPWTSGEMHVNVTSLLRFPDEDVDLYALMVETFGGR